MAGQAKTIVEYFAEHERYRCGYCGTQDTNFSHGMWAHAMTVQDYQDLLDRGWRRSGKYVYKPTMDKTCCPQHTIRCEVLNFTLRKSHKKAIKKVNKYLIHGRKPSTDKDEAECDMSNDNQPKTGSDADKDNVSNQSTEKAAEGVSQSDSKESMGNQSQEKKTPHPGVGADPNKPKSKKAKDLRKEKKLAKLVSKEASASGTQKATEPKPGKSEGKTLEELLDEPNKADNCAHKLEIRLVRSCPRSREFEDSVAESHKVYHRYQMAIHNDTPDKPSMKQFTRFLIDSPLEVKLVRTHPKSGEFKSSLDQSYEVYKRYQMSIHKEEESECGQSTYTGFLVDSPLEEEKGSLPAGYGSFHQQYILDGKIICVGVIDILPNLVSSKYLYYDPDYHFLSLGTYSALREIAFVRELNKHAKDLVYYYMGFYIHSCPKMKYKGQYHPSFLLCPETYTWHAVEKCSPMLDQKPYCRFADASQEDENGRVDLDSIIILYMRQMMTYTIYKMLSKDANHDEEEVKEYAGFVGKKGYSKMLLFRK